MVYKYCIVPCCRSSTAKTPGKTFFSMPKNASVRKKWMVAMRRQHSLAPTTRGHCCEDHFNVEQDQDNLVRFRLMGGPVKLKAGVVPHLFLCQRGRASTHPVKKRLAVEKRQHREAVTDAVSATVGVDSDAPSFDDIDSPASPDIEEGQAAPPFDDMDSSAAPAVVSKGTQTKIRPGYYYRSNGTQVTAKVDSKACSPLKLQFKSTASSPMKSARRNTSIETNISDSAEDGQPSDTDEDYVEEIASSSDAEELETLSAYPFTVKKMMANPKTYMGLELESLFVLNVIVSLSQIPLRNILLTLRKIRLNEAFIILKDEFAISRQLCGRIFFETCVKLQPVFKKCIVWPSADVIRLNLPIAFRARFQKVVAIIDCLEIEIEKPSNALHQSLTWSDYKKCNTVKYLIACTPDGTCCFISNGFGGRTSDAVILKESGFLEKLVPGMQIMADRGFKQVEADLRGKGCTIVRPPSCSAAEIFSKEEVRLTKSIASLRIHVERVIGRLRDFEFFGRHACVSNKLLCLTDPVIVVACGLVNLQRPIIQK